MSDAAALSEVLLDVLKANPKPVSDDERSRIASRCAPLKFEHLQPLYASIERDPIHPAACYICADGVDSQPVLLRVAPATSPSSGLFPKSILIGRTHLRQFEVVVNAIPFGPDDSDRVEVFAQQVNKAFRPRAAGSKPVTVVRTSAPIAALPLVFEAARRRLKAGGRVTLGFAEAPEHVIEWAAIRAGWREGYAFPPFESVANTIDVEEGMPGNRIELLLT